MIKNPPAKPLLIFDGDCHFCRYWVLRWRRRTGDAVTYSPYQIEGEKFPEIPLDAFTKAVQLILPDGTHVAGAEAAFRALATAKRFGWPLWIYERVPLMKHVCEWFYRRVARNRPFFSKLTRLAWGGEINPPTYLMARWIFLRALGFIYLAAFVSLWVQVDGLFGSRGITPFAAQLQLVSERFGKVYFGLPTLFWFSVSDTALHVACGVGVAASILIISGFFSTIALATAWAIYLSFVTLGTPFLSFQWDLLLLETGFLAIFLAPMSVSIRSQRAHAPHAWPVFLLQLLLFKLLFMSGLLKIERGDAAWRDLTALTYHYQTQPLPTWIGYFAHHLPVVFQKFSTLLVLACELIVPFFIFLPRRFRYVAFYAEVGLQILIALTGNYAFFNLLTMALCVLLLDDSFWSDDAKSWVADASDPQPPARNWPSFVLVPIVVFVLVLNSLICPLHFNPGKHYPATVGRWAMEMNRCNFVNGYGLFAVMTTTRNEIVLEGSNDAQTWLPYEFKYKPGSLGHRPAFVAPHQPRLDWQMWFAALGTYQENPWLMNLAVRIMQGSEPALNLLATNPFPKEPPHYVRAVIYEYRFSTLAEKRATGSWWTRSAPQIYFEPISLGNNPP